MKYSEFLVSNFEGLFMFLVVFGVACLSLNLFQVLQIISFGGNMDELYQHIVYIIIIILYMFLTNYLGQEIADHNDRVFVTAYNIQWYVAPLQTQRMILFLLQRNKRTFNLNIGGIVTGSLENFASVKYLMEELQRICNELKDKNEIAIIKKYGNNAKLYTATLTCKRT
ncbi:PREDICTED: uncharacterized protein LOC106746663 [Dinoponera quadriceps]|uniref:Uncharacterized protein LOC106746663 n=1 Tax=Dinoponera quadriceps TaxID=609295 RepID=A0A6P3XLT9_DINQU|nr:PREDICTED: uncharacterized protein LOC106746663 [Dinoponera quadriceps]